MDYTYTFVPNLVWFLVELYFGILCACLPSLKPFTKRYFPGFSLFSDNLESHLSTSMDIVSQRVRNITTGLGRSAGANTRRNEQREWEQRSMSRIGADIPQSKPGHASVFNGVDNAPILESGSSSEGSSTFKEFHVVGEKSSGSSLREVEESGGNNNMAKEVDV